MYKKNLVYFFHTLFKQFNIIIFVFTCINEYIFKLIIFVVTKTIFKTSCFMKLFKINI